MNHMWITTSLIAQLFLFGQASTSTSFVCDNNTEPFNTPGSFTVPKYQTQTLDKHWKFVDASNSTALLISIKLDADVDSSSASCKASIDHITLPNGTQVCRSTNMCVIYLSPFRSSTSGTDALQIKNKNVSENCEISQSLTWPPTMCLMRRTAIMGLNISHHFLQLSSTQLQARNSSGDQNSTSTEVSTTTTTAAVTSTAMFSRGLLSTKPWFSAAETRTMDTIKSTSVTFAEISGQDMSLLYALLFSAIASIVIIIVAVIYLRRKRARELSKALKPRGEINPYAVHVRLRTPEREIAPTHRTDTPYDTIDLDGNRATETTPGYHGVGQTRWTGGERNLTLLEDADAYLLPISKERQYHEIVVSAGESPKLDRDYDAAQDVPHTSQEIGDGGYAHAQEIGGGGYAHAQDVPTPKREHVKYSEVVMAPDEDNNYLVTNKEHSPIFALRESAGAEDEGSGYGEIIGTVDQGKLVRFNETEVKYKSVRKIAK